MCRYNSIRKTSRNTGFQHLTAYLPTDEETCLSWNYLRYIFLGECSWGLKLSFNADLVHCFQDSLKNEFRGIWDQNDPDLPFVLWMLMAFLCSIYLKIFRKLLYYTLILSCLSANKIHFSAVYIPCCFLRSR